MSLSITRIFSAIWGFPLYIGTSLGKLWLLDPVPLSSFLIIVFNGLFFTLNNPLIIEDDPNYVHSKSWAEMIRKVCEVDPLYYPSYSGQMKVISFIEEPKTINRIICHLELTFEAERPASDACKSAGTPEDG